MYFLTFIVFNFRLKRERILVASLRYYLTSMVVILSITNQTVVNASTAFILKLLELMQYYFSKYLVQFEYFLSKGICVSRDKVLQKLGSLERFRAFLKIHTVFFQDFGILSRYGYVCKLMDMFFKCVALSKPEPLNYK